MAYFAKIYLDNVIDILFYGGFCETCIRWLSSLAVVNYDNIVTRTVTDTHTHTHTFILSLFCSFDVSPIEGGAKVEAP